MRQLIFLGACAFLSAAPSDRDLFTAFYPEPIISNTLAAFEIPFEEQSSIIAALSNHELDVITKVEEKAGQMEQNPLAGGDQDAVVKLFNTVVSEIFSNVMYVHGITNDEEIQAMIRDVYRQKADRFRHCMESLPGT